MDHDTESGPATGRSRSLGARLFGDLAADAGRLVAAFAIGAAAGAVLCLYFGLPVIVGLGGGLVVLGLVLALMPNGPFF
ncbi:hypothetical protein ACQ5SP_13480 [Rhodovulum sp. YNF3179]|uniref:hypothetical protein n=1 Tax=Rhodovulum sp. YNF3179 TaxID=3425127 RepID=UPI003D3482BC